MLKKTMAAFFAFAAVAAVADNSLTTEQLVKVTQLSLQDYAVTSPEMTKSISGFKVTTVDTNAKVIIYMNADGMNMTANYLCIRNGADFACHFQN